MFTKSPLKPILLALAMLAGLAPAAMASVPEVATAPQAAATARVWFLRPASPGSTGFGAAPTIYANGTPITAISADTAFYRDLAPGTYRFAVEPYGLPTDQSDTLRLLPGSQTYLEVQWVPTWEEGYPNGAGADSHSFFVLNLSPQLAQAYLPSLTNLGQD